MTGPSASHARLREATAPDHARVDACFADGLCDAGSYLRYVRGMHALLSGLAQHDATMASEYADHRMLLGEDLAALGVPARVPPTTSAMGDDDARLGARYVFEGSALGARLLQRQALALGHTPVSGARFLAYHVDRGYTHWPRLMQALAQHDPASPGFQATLTAARDTFALAAACFDPMGATAKDLDERPDRH